MPYCSQCGNQVRDTDLFCGSCGASQPVIPPAGSSAAGASAPLPPAPDILGGISPRSASLLCYVPILGWIAAIVVLASARFRDNRDVRFHAFQGLYLFVAWLIVDWVVGPGMRVMWHGWPGFFPFGGLMKALVFAAWIIMIIKTAQDKVFRLPILGELADRSVSEQK